MSLERFESRFTAEAHSSVHREAATRAAAASGCASVADAKGGSVGPCAEGGAATPVGDAPGTGATAACEAAAATAVPRAHRRETNPGVAAGAASGGGVASSGDDAGPPSLADPHSVGAAGTETKRTASSVIF